MKKISKKELEGAGKQKKMTKYLIFSKSIDNITPVRGKPTGKGVSPLRAGTDLTGGAANDGENGA